MHVVLRRTLSGLKKSEQVVSAGLAGAGEEIWTAFMKSLALQRQAPQTLLHQDVHPGNWYRDAEGGMGLYDWQALARGHWAQDWQDAPVRRGGRRARPTSALRSPRGAPQVEHRVMLRRRAGTEAC